MSSRTRFLNCHFDNIGFTEVLDVVNEHTASRVPGFMVSVNTDIVVQLDRDADFRDAFNAANLALMDSQPLIKLCEKCGLHVQEKLSGSDLMPWICGYAAAIGLRCFILGGKEGVPEEACRKLTLRYPELDIAGYSPEFGFEHDERKLQSVIAEVRRSSPDIMFICLGTPKSEKILYTHLQEFNVPFTFSVGAAVDFVSGNINRAPVWMQRAGLEWFYRFLREPKRLFRRYFIDSWRLLGIACRSGVLHQT